MPRTIVVDFDGTITEQDLLDEIAETFGDPEVYRELDKGLDRRELTLHEVLRREFEPVRASLDDVVDWVLAHARIRPGFRELIEPVLAREGLSGVELYSNSVDPDPRGWRVRFLDETLCKTCEQACKRSTVSALADGSEVVYVGDGYSDRCAAEDADLVFARRGLAAYLSGRGVPFEPFDDFFQIAGRIARLDGGGRAS